MCIIHPLSQTNISFISCTLFLKMIFRMYYTIIISSWYSFSIINIFLRIISVCNIQYHSQIYISCIFVCLKFLSSMSDKSFSNPWPKCTMKFLFRIDAISFLNWCPLDIILRSQYDFLYVLYFIFLQSITVCDI